MTAAELRELQLPGVRLQALAWGAEDAPLAVCLHGFPDTPYTWRHLGPRLAAAGWRVIAPFTRGYYPSEVPADGRYDVGALMQDAIDIHTVLGGDDRAVLIGHDWGAVTSNTLARSERSPYSRVVSIAVPPMEVFDIRRPAVRTAGLVGKQMTLSWYMMFHQLPRLPERMLPRLVELYWRRWSPGFDATDDLQHVADAMFRPENRRAVIGYYRALPRTGMAMRARSTAETDILYIHGAGDGCMTVDWIDPTQEIPHRQIEIVDGGGHFVQLEQPDEVYRLVRDFIG